MIKTAPIYYSTYLIPPLLFFTDSFLFFLFGLPYVQTLWCWYLLQLISRGTLCSGPTILALPLLLLQSMLWHQLFALNVFSLIPCTALAIFLSDYIYRAYIPCLIVIALSLAATLTIVDYTILGHQISKNYTISVIFVNLLISWLLANITLK